MIPETSYCLKQDSQVIPICPICHKHLTKHEANLRYCVKKLPGKTHQGCGNKFDFLLVYDFETGLIMKYL